MPPSKIRVQAGIGIANVLVANYLIDLSENDLRGISLELRETGTVDGVEVVKTFIDSQKEDETKFDFLTYEGGPRF